MGSIIRYRSCGNYYRVPSVLARLKRASDGIVDRLSLLQLDVTTALRNGRAAHMNINCTLAFDQRSNVESHYKAYVVSSGL